MQCEAARCRSATLGGCGNNGARVPSIICLLRLELNLPLSWPLILFDIFINVVQVYESVC
eukprot:318073-Chlamydomonas_euryale.AAC.2